MKGSTLTTEWGKIHLKIMLGKGAQFSRFRLQSQPAKQERAKKDKTNAHNYEIILIISTRGLFGAGRLQSKHEHVHRDECSC